MGQSESTLHSDHGVLNFYDVLDVGVAGGDACSSPEILGSRSWMLVICTGIDSGSRKHEASESCENTSSVRFILQHTPS